MPFREAPLKNKGSALAHGTMGSLAPASHQDNLSGEREIPGTGFLERAEGLWYDATVLEWTSRSFYWPAI
jgi:hypothetical protein